MDEFPAETLAYVLSKHGVLKYDGPPPDEVDEDTGAVQPKVGRRKRPALGGGYVNVEV